MVEVHRNYNGLGKKQFIETERLFLKLQAGRRTELSPEDYKQAKHSKWKEMKTSMPQRCWHPDFLCFVGLPKLILITDLLLTTQK